MMESHNPYIISSPPSRELNKFKNPTPPAAISQDEKKLGKSFKGTKKVGSVLCTIPVPGKHLFSRIHPRANEPQGKKAAAARISFSGLLSEVFGGGGVGAKRRKWANLVAPQTSCLAKRGEGVGSAVRRRMVDICSSPISLGERRDFFDENKPSTQSFT